MTMVFNLTDVPTPALKRLGWANISIQVGGRTIPPGKAADFKAVPHGEVAPFLPAGALAFGRPPPAYFKAKGKVVARDTLELRVKVEPAPADFVRVHATLPAEEEKKEEAPPAKKKAKKKKTGVEAVAAKLLEGEGD